MDFMLEEGTWGRGTWQPHLHPAHGLYVSSCTPGMKWGWMNEGKKPWVKRNPRLPVLLVTTSHCPSPGVANLSALCNKEPAVAHVPYIHHYCPCPLEMLELYLFSKKFSHFLYRDEIIV